jgi:hypothetical protein
LRLSFGFAADDRGVQPRRSFEVLFACRGQAIEIAGERGTTFRDALLPFFADRVQLGLLSMARSRSARASAIARAICFSANATRDRHSSSTERMCSRPAVIGRPRCSYRRAASPSNEAAMVTPRGVECHRPVVT